MAEVKLPRGSLTLATAAVAEARQQPRISPRGEDEAIARAVLEAALPVTGRAALRDAAARILLAADLAAGQRCPACHAKPATRSYDLSASRFRYGCGCGHEWDGSRQAREDRFDSVDRSLRLLAAGKPLPELPPKEDSRD